MIGIIDYDAGNIKSVSKAVERLGGKGTVTSDPDMLAKCDAMILPGVGSFGKAIENLDSRGLTQCVKENVRQGKLLLGICLGMQLLFDKSYEDGEFDGLGLIGGKIARFGTFEGGFDKTLKVPHMGWNKLVENRPDSLGEGVAPGEYVYFVHSYYAVPTDFNDVVYYGEYSVKVPALVRKDNVIGMQFHPEKSSVTGLKLLENFLKEAAK